MHGRISSMAKIASEINGLEIWGEWSARIGPVIAGGFCFDARAQGRSAMLCPRAELGNM